MIIARILFTQLRYSWNHAEPVTMQELSVVTKRAIIPNQCLESWILALSCARLLRRLLCIKFNRIYYDQFNKNGVRLILHESHESDEPTSQSGRGMSGQSRK